MTAFLRRTYDGGGTTTTLASAMGAFDTSFAIFSSTGWPGTLPGSSSGFIVVIDRGLITEEKILCSGNSGTTVSVATSGRGYDGTSATAHAASAIVSLCAGAIDLDEANQVTNLMGNMAAGSIPVGAGSGTLATPLAIGTTGQVLQVVAGEPAWGGVGSPSLNAASVEASFTAAGQLFAGTGSGSGEQLAKGSAGQVLTVGGADASGLEWAPQYGVANLKPTADQTGNYVANPGDLVESTSDGQMTVPNTAGVVTAVKQQAGGAATVILPSGGHIDGQTSVQLGTPGSALVLLGDGTNVEIIGSAPGQWTSFTPTWTGTSTNPAIGNGSADYYWRWDGQSVQFMISLKFGSTTTYGSGQWSFTGLPFTASFIPIGSIVMFTGVANPAGTLIQVCGVLSSNTLSLYYGAMAGVLTGTSPDTFASGEYLTISGVLPA